jgi:hypothetical protein
MSKTPADAQAAAARTFVAAEMRKLGPRSDADIRAINVALRE